MTRIVLISVCVVALVAATTALTISTDSENEMNYIFWLNEHGVNGTDAIRANFKDNADKVSEWNAAGDGATYATNQFSGMSWDEFRETRLGYKAGRSVLQTVFESSNLTVPASVDWRNKGAVTPVKDQGNCGSCWAFSTTGSVEGMNFLAKGKLTSLSEQDLVDCSKDFYNDGCNGGRVDWAFQYLIKDGGDDTEASYPYKGVDGVCQSKKGVIGATVASFSQVKEGDEDALKAAVAQQPVSVAIDVTDKLANYKSGVFSDSECKNGEMDLDHAVLVVGYGTENGDDYWIVKNSWNAKWGDKGYFKMARNKNNMCGIATNAYVPKAN